VSEGRKIGGGDVVGLEDALGHDLIHGQSTCQHSGAGIGDAHEIQQPLDRAILPEAAMKGDKGNLRTAEIALLEGRSQRQDITSFRDGGKKRSVLAVLQGQQFRGRKEPCGVQGQGLISLPIQGLKHHPSCFQGYLALRGVAPHQNSNFELAGHRNS